MYNPDAASDAKAELKSPGAYNYWDTLCRERHPRTGLVYMTRDRAGKRAGLYPTEITRYQKILIHHHWIARLADGGVLLIKGFEHDLEGIKARGIDQMGWVKQKDGTWFNADLDLRTLPIHKDKGPEPGSPTHRPGGGTRSGSRQKKSSSSSAARSARPRRTETGRPSDHPTLKLDSPTTGRDNPSLSDPSHPTLALEDPSLELDGGLDDPTLERDYPSPHHVIDLKEGSYQGSLSLSREVAQPERMERERVTTTPKRGGPPKAKSKYPMPLWYQFVESMIAGGAHIPNPIVYAKTSRDRGDDEAIELWFEIERQKAAAALKAESRDQAASREEHRKLHAELTAKRTRGEPMEDWELEVLWKAEYEQQKTAPRSVEGVA